MRSALIACCLLCFVSTPALAKQSIQTAFSPSPRSTQLVVSTIEHAKHTVRLAGYSFTSQAIADALIAAHQEGRDVMVVVDKSQMHERHTVIGQLAAAGVPVRVNWHYAIMHNKFIVADKNTVETGSFNYTASAEKRNAENIIVISDNRNLAEKYLERWQLLWDEAEDYAPEGATTY